MTKKQKRTLYRILASGLLFLLGLLLIVKGGDFFVDAAVWMAEVSGMPKFLGGSWKALHPPSGLRHYWLGCPLEGGPKYYKRPGL